MLSPYRTCIGALVAACLPLILASPCHAQGGGPAQRAEAEALYGEAVVALERKDHATACPMLEKVVQLWPQGIGAKLTLAECHEEAGRLATAWRAYTAAADAARAAGQADRERRARARAKALEPRLARLTLVVPERLRALPGLTIWRDGEPIAPAAWGTPSPVDRGSRLVEATAAGRSRWEGRVEVPRDGAAHSIEIGEPPAPQEAGTAAAPPAAATPAAGLPAAPASGAPAPAEAASPPAQAGGGGESPGPAVTAPPSGAVLVKSSAGAGGAETPDDSARARSVGAAMRTGGLVLGILGLAGVGVATASGIIAIDKHDESNASHCQGNQCDPVGIELREASMTAGTVSTVMFVAGGAALAGGAVLFLTAPKPREPAVAVAPGRVVVRLRW